jgi:tetratricopeptide (TPR) repeat protein
MAENPSHEAPVHQASALPVALPGKIAGRESLLAQVYGHLKSNKAVLLYGASGMGKTAVAATLASAYTELPGGAVWLNVNDPTLEQLIARVGRAYDVPEIKTAQNPLGMVAGAASALTAGKPLLVLDGKQSAATADFVTRCAAGLPALMISKERLEGPWTPVEVTKLDAKPAMLMLRHEAGLPAEGMDSELDELTSILDYTPFALAVAGGTLRVSKQLPQDYLTAFEKIPSSAGATPPLLALTIAFKGLNNALQGVLLLMGATFGVAVSAEMLSTMANAPQPTIEQVMNLLAQNNLVERFTRAGSPVYRLHEITQTFMTTWLRSQGRLDMLQNKTRDAVLTFVKKYSTNTPVAQDRLAEEMEIILAAAKWSADQGERDLVNQIVVGLMQAGDFTHSRGYVYDLLKLRELSSSFTTPFPAYPAPPAPPVMPAPEDAFIAETDDDEDNEDDDLVVDFDGDEDEDDDLSDTLEDGDTVRGLAASPSLLDLEAEDDETEDDVLPDDDQSDTAAGIPVPAVPVDEQTRLHNALRAAKQSNDLVQQVALLKQLGEYQARNQMEVEAISSYDEALTAYETLGQKTAMLDTLDILSALMVKTENSSAAVLHATRGIALADELNDRETQLQLLVTLADARQQLGESDEAARAYSKALEIARTTDDRQNEALVLYKLGYAQLDTNQPEVAADTWEQALSLFKGQSKRDYEGRVLGALGTASGEQGRWEEAIKFHTSALYIAREVKDREVEALELGNLGYASVQANQLGQAVTRYRQALHLAYLANDRDNIISNIVDLARLLTESRKHLELADMLINDAIPLDPTDRDVLKLKERITSGKMQALAEDVVLLKPQGNAKDYAANAYALLEG